jgi:hypothetical protein
MTSKCKGEKKRPNSKNRSCASISVVLRICQTQDISEDTLFQYELTSHPTSLFDDDDRMLLANKPELAKCIEKNVVIDSCCVTFDTNT